MVSPREFSVPEPTRRQRRKVLTDRMVAALPRRRKRHFHPDPEMPGHGVRVYPAGPSAFYVIARDAFKKQRWVKLGGTAEMGIEQSRERARTVIRRLRDGLEPFEAPKPKPDSVADVCATWIKRHVEAKGLRTGDELQRVLERHVLPVWKDDQPFADIRRSDIARLLDAVEDKHGPWVADSVLSALRSVASWYASRHDTYVPPFTKNMRRVPAHQRKRSRFLSDDELRAVWKTAEGEDSALSALVRVLLLTGQRREKVASMRWDDVAPDGTWTIPTAPREKGNPGTLKLPPLAIKIIRSRSRFASNEYVFAGRRPGEPIAGFATWHLAFRKRSGVDGWTLHDLRRTARSLLSRVGVRPDIAERCLGHAVGGAIAQTYDRHAYTVEIGNALAKLARLIEQIVRGKPGDNVVPMVRP
jgi:integrase